MSQPLPSPNFLWPAFGQQVAVTLQLTRDRRHGQLHLQAWQRDDAGFVEPWATASVVPHDGVNVFLCGAADEFYVKNYSENQGVLAALVAQGYVEDLDAAVRPQHSFVDFPRVRLTPKGRALAPELFG